MTERPKHCLKNNLVTSEIFYPYYHLEYMNTASHIYPSSLLSSIPTRHQTQLFTKGFLFYTYIFKVPLPISPINTTSHTYGVLMSSHTMYFINVPSPCHAWPLVEKIMHNTYTSNHHAYGGYGEEGLTG